MRKHWPALAAVMVVGLPACSSDSDDEKKPAPKLDYIFHQQVLDEDNAAVEGVELCVDERPDIPCVKTDATGVADLLLPKNSLLVITYTKQDFITKRRPFQTEEDPIPGFGAWVFQRRTWYEGFVQAAGASTGAVDFDAKGLIGLQVGSLIGQPEFDFKIEPPGGAFGPMRACVNSNKLEYCPTKTNNDTGVGAFANVDPGKVRAFMTTPGMTCTPELLPCADGAESCTEVDVRAGALTHHFFDCK